MNYITIQPDGDLLILGRQGENKVRQVRFPEAGAWPSVFGSGAFSLVHQRPGETGCYPVALDSADGVPVWTVEAADLAIASRQMQCGKAELRYTVGDRVAKSRVYHTVIYPGVCSQQTTPPQPEAAWVDQVLQAAEQTLQAKTSAENAAASAQEAAELAAATAALLPAPSDLETIRAGAALGATAVQPETGKGLFSGSYNDLTNKPTIPDELADLTQDSTHRTVTDADKSAWNAKGTYSKPSGGIPASDLASAVQSSLSKADSALQSVPNTYRTSAAQDVIDGGKQNTLVSGVNIKTVNGQTLLGSGNVAVGMNYTSNEQDTGMKWIDGRTVWQVSCSGTVMEESSYTNPQLLLSVNAWNVPHIIEVSGSVKTSSSIFWEAYNGSYMNYQGIPERAFFTVRGDFEMAIPGFWIQFDKAHPDIDYNLTFRYVLDPTPW